MTGATDLARPGGRAAGTAAAQRVLIVGGGTAGTIAAVHLLRAAGRRRRLDLVVVDPSGEARPGVAYRTPDPAHLLNVPAARMGAVAGRPEDFWEWLRARDERVNPAAYLPRATYGAYLRDLVANARREAPAARLAGIRGEATSLVETGTGVRVGLADGRRIEADRAVLALGPLPGRDPIAVPDEVRDSGRYLADPWRDGALAAARGARRVLVIGTGLTMIDVALSLAEAGAGVLAVSRTGLVPRAHRPGLTRIEPFEVAGEPISLGTLAVAFIERLMQSAADGGDWRDAIDSLRPVTPEIWRRLSVGERRRFVERHRRLWEAHRFRMAPEVAARFEALRRDGRVRVAGGGIAAIEPAGEAVRVTVGGRGNGGSLSVEVNLVVNCTGAGGDVTEDPPPLIADLLASGTARPDELRLGLDVDPDGALIGRDGRRSARISVVGELRKGVEWEAIGVTEIREHAAAAAALTVAEGTGR